MEAELEAARSVVASLRSLLMPAQSPFEVSHRHVPATAALVVRATIDLADLSAWYETAARQLEDAVAAAGIEPAGPRGGLWDTELFLHERGEAALFRPVFAIGDVNLPLGRIRTEVLPARDLAVTVHRGSDDTIAQVYGALGEYVTTHGLGVDGPIWEVYLEPSGADSHAVTEIGWPISAPGA